MADSFHEYQPSIRPPWHQGENGEKWHEAMGTLKDVVCEGQRQAVLSRWVKSCPEDALAIHGKYLGWPQAPGETSNEYRKRLGYNWELAQWRGTEFGIILALELLGLTNVQCRESFSPLWGRQKDGGGNIIPSKARWCNVIIRHPHPFGTDFAFRYGDGTTYGSGKVYGPNGDPRWFPLLQQLVKRQKPAHAFCEWIAIVLAGDVIDGTDSPSDGEPDGALSRVAYLPVR